METQGKKLYVVTVTNYTVLGIFGNIRQAHSEIQKYLGNDDITPYNTVCNKLTNQNKVSIHFKANEKYCASIEAYKLNESVI